MSTDRLINIVVMVALIEMMLTIGLQVTFHELFAVARNWRLVTRAGLANYVCVPAATVGLLWLFDANPLVAIGFLILATCPGAPYGPPFTGIAKGSVPEAVGLMVLLAGSSAIVAPLMLRMLLPLLSEQKSFDVDTTKIITTLLLTQLLPLGVGIVVRQTLPNLTIKLQKPADALSKVLNLFAVGLILVVQFPLLAAIRPSGFAGMGILLLASCAAGWLLGGATWSGRTTMVITTSLRNISVGLVIATGSFAGTPAVTAVVAYGLVSLFGTLALAIILNKYSREGNIKTSDN